MPNDYQALRSIALNLGPMPNGPPAVEQPPPVDYANVRLDNTVGMASNIPNLPLVAGDLPNLNSVNLAIVNEADVRGLLTNQGVPVMGCKVQFEYQIGRQGAREIFYANINDPSAVPAARLAEYVVRRLAFSGGQTTILRARVTLIGTRFSSIAYTAQQLQVASILPWTNTGNFTGGTSVVQDSAPPDEALIVTRSSTTGNRSERFFLAGFPDVATNDAGEFNPPPGFISLFNAWSTFVIAQTWGWFGQPSGGNARYNITAMTNTTGQVNFTLEAPGPFPSPALPVNTPVRVRGLTSPFRFLNGPLVVLPVSPTQCTSIRLKPFPPGAGAPELGAAQMYLQVPPTFYSITSMGIEPFSGSRRRGNPPGEPRGRQRNRVWN